MPDVQLTTYDPQYAWAFAALNYEWIEAYFAVEDEDRAALEDPEGYALTPGGEIYFVLQEGEPVGTVAMVPFKGHSDGKAYELAKMAVRPDCQGRGYSHLLMQACIRFAKDHDADEIVLVTNDALKPALGLYTQSGFVAMPAYTDTRYSRGNLEMRLQL